jgi:hypothetical protein
LPEQLWCSEDHCTPAGGIVSVAAKKLGAWQPHCRCDTSAPALASMRCTMPTWTASPLWLEHIIASSCDVKP